MNRKTFLMRLWLSWIATVYQSLISLLLAPIKFLLAATPESTGVEPVIFYIAPNGNDEWSGKLREPNQFNTDGPWATSERVRNAIHELKHDQSGILNQPIQVFLREGNYFLKAPLMFTHEDSGQGNFSISYSAYQDEKPVISGGRQILGWQEVSLNGKRLWIAQLPDVENGQWFFRQLWVNGQRCTRARYPNQGYLQIADVPDTNPETQWNQGQSRFHFRNGDLKAWTTLDDAEVVVMAYWQEWRASITNIDESQQLIYFDQKSATRIKPGDLYYIEHAFELLDTPGEWYLQKRTGKLYYLPRPHENLSNVEVIAPVIPHLIHFKGTPETGQFVDNILFNDLTFAHAEWYKRGAAQAAFFVPGAVYLEGTRSCKFTRCTFAHLSSYALELADGCQHNHFVGCQIFDLGAGGIKIGEPLIQNNYNQQTFNNEIIDCKIYNGGHIFHSAVGIWVGQSYGNRITHNHIYDFYYTGISIGWTWGYGSTLAKDNIIEFNHIHHIGLLSNGDGPLLNDKGGIYTLGVQPGTVIRYNKIHDIQAFNYGGWGIYLDEGSSQILIEKNLVYRTRDGGFHQHYGKENIIQNNIFAFGTVAQIRRSTPEPHLSFTFERNIVYWQEGTLLFGNWADSNFLFDYNIYWQVGGKEIRFDNVSWQEWKAKGKDQNSIIADPLFVAPEQGDFRLSPNSPAFQLGFQPISWVRNQ